MVDVSVIIVSFNCKSILKQCLLSLRTVTDVTFDVWLVDNASSDGTQDMVRTEFPEVHFIASPDNLGFSKGNNLAIRQATDSRYLLLLNPDTVVMPETFLVMVSYMDKYNRIGASTCRVEFPDGQLDLDCRRSFPTPWVSFCQFSGLSGLFPTSRIFGRYHLSYFPETEVHEIDACKGAFMMVRRETLNQVGILDEDFFFYGEDIDWCYRIKEAGWKVTYNPSTKIIHYEGVSSGLKQHSRSISTATRETRKIVTKARFDAMKIFYAKHYTKKYPRILTSLVLFAVEVKRAFANLQNQVAR